MTKRHLARWARSFAEKSLGNRLNISVACRRKPGGLRNAYVRGKISPGASDSRLNSAIMVPSVRPPRNETGRRRRRGRGVVPARGGGPATVMRPGSHPLLVPSAEHNEVAGCPFVPMRLLLSVIGDPRSEAGCPRWQSRTMIAARHPARFRWYRTVSYRPRDEYVVIHAPSNRASNSYHWPTRRGRDPAPEMPALMSLS